MKWLILIVIVFVFVGSSYLNAKIKVPEDLELPEKCVGCQLQCNKKEVTLTKEIIDEIKADIKCQEENNER